MGVIILIVIVVVIIIFSIGWNIGGGINAWIDNEEAKKKDREDE